MIDIQHPYYELKQFEHGWVLHHIVFHRRRKLGLLVLLFDWLLGPSKQLFQMPRQYHFTTEPKKLIMTTKHKLYTDQHYDLKCDRVEIRQWWLFVMLPLLLLLSILVYLTAHLGLYLLNEIKNIQLSLVFLGFLLASIVLFYLIFHAVKDWLSNQKIIM
ncbi:hypothetical protein SAMN04488134_109126 [Amphibacillus marinus]|uniref:Uncharacterized protein n=1 Tax=Amphibacillus marinus TaxID=872970 RepID=A0A1H8R258_9BACI|nr:hypothetical protein [Amphibacillus marinus]SEO60502.1 hypothetical protein SAMN04488134_109126 [Amphibacillus marinus]